MKTFGICWFSVFICGVLTKDTVIQGREGKVLPVFQVVRFPNDGCEVSGGSKNGTCYTAEECSSRGGVNAGSCASGFGVCCTFSVGCGSTATENCTYFSSATTVNAGPCRARVCKLNSNICQMRLDFNTFVITGPATMTLTIGKHVHGVVNEGAGQKEVAERTQCLTDTFTISNQVSVPVICGTNTGYHVYFDASDACHNLDFQLGPSAVNIAAVATRSWDIKISQYSCGYENLAPTGCTQYHYGTGATDYVYSFNYGTGSNLHLAEQHQIICVRRESGNCKICWFADAEADVGIAGAAIAASNMISGGFCCGYKVADGKASMGYDCLMIPGAVKVAATDGQIANSICGSGKGLYVIAAAGAIATTVCSKQIPFRVSFFSDQYEFKDKEVDPTGRGFKLRYVQSPCT